MKIKTSMLETQMIFTKTLLRGLKLKSMEDRGRLFTMIAEYLALDKEPDLSECDLALELIFEDVKEGAAVSTKKYGEKCEGNYWQELTRKAREMGCFKEGGKVDAKAFERDYPDIANTLREKHLMDTIEGGNTEKGDKAAVQGESVPDYEKPYGYEGMSEEEPYERLPFAGLEDEEEPEKEEPPEEARQERELSEEEKALLREFEEVFPYEGKSKFDECLEGYNNDVEKVKKWLAWYKAFDKAVREGVIHHSACKEIFQLKREEVDSPEDYIDALIEAKEPLAEIFEEEEITKIISRLNYDAEKVRELGRRIKELCVKDADAYEVEWQKRNSKIRAHDAVIRDGMAVKDIFAALDSWERSIETLKRISSTLKAAKPAGEEEEELPFA